MVKLEISFSSRCCVFAFGSQRDNHIRSTVPYCHGFILDRPLRLDMISNSSVERQRRPRGRTRGASRHCVRKGQRFFSMSQTTEGKVRRRRRLADEQLEAVNITSDAIGHSWYYFALSLVLDLVILRSYMFVHKVDQI